MRSYAPTGVIASALSESATSDGPNNNEESPFL